jgi:hypothetical protein
MGEKKYMNFIILNENIDFMDAFARYFVAV